MRTLTRAAAVLLLGTASVRAEITSDILTASNTVRQTVSSGTNYFMGKVGIGTATPVATLHVNGFPWITYEAPTLTLNDDTAGDDDWYIRANVDNFYVSQYVNDSTWTHRMTITGAGRVGIGTTGPQGMLHVVGNLFLTDYVEIYHAYPRLFFTDTTTGDDDWGLLIDADAMQFRQKVGDITWTERMRLDGSGRLGVGTNSPSEALHVVGAGRFDNGIVYVKKLGDLSMGTYTNTP